MFPLPQLLLTPAHLPPQPTLWSLFICLFVCLSPLMMFLKTNKQAQTPKIC